MPAEIESGTPEREIEADVIMMGSGAAGLSAALTAAGHGAKTVVLERSDRYGGTTTLSGRVIWLPGNGRSDEPRSMTPGRTCSNIWRASRMATRTAI